ncbi:hypothetical protein [Desulfopila inferna]|uniref:hypothetical protein n=1 Tax=Desulfopila inferna TaxID=468528 RepID=UPI00196461B9|nr:hypothetical protein [Desulfopila inferna]MBM9605263.1 hypothetical protein [Desulfopila inferna]
MIVHYRKGAYKAGEAEKWILFVLLIGFVLFCATSAILQAGNWFYKQEIKNVHWTTWFFLALKTPSVFYMHVLKQDAQKSCSNLSFEKSM